MPGSSACIRQDAELPPPLCIALTKGNSIKRSFDMTTNFSNNVAFNRYRKPLFWLLGIVAVLLVAKFSAYAVLSYLGWGYHNPVTPAGYVGYVTRGAVVGKSEFVAIQEGPTSPGSGWLLNVINIPKRQ